MGMVVNVSVFDASEALDTIVKMTRQYVTSLRNVNLDIPPPPYEDPVGIVRDVFTELATASFLLKDCEVFKRYGLYEGLKELSANLHTAITYDVLVSDIIQGFAEEIRLKEPRKARALEKYDEMLTRAKIPLLVDIESKLGECLCKYAGKGKR